MSKSIIAYVPHGINNKDYHPITEQNPHWKEFDHFSTEFKKNNNFEFLVFWNNRNVRRKNPGDVILSFRHFCDKLNPKEAEKCALLMHTNIVDMNGTDLIEVKKAIAAKYKVIFSDQKVPSIYLNYYYNIADVTLNIASNEGFGLSGAESLMAGTPIINNCTGGLQDQMNFTTNSGVPIMFDSSFQSNHIGKFTKHGEWAKPVYPSNRSLQGSPQTPYIFDDRCDFRDVADAIMYWYKMPKDERIAAGLKGREWVKSRESGMSSEEMSRRMQESIEKCLDAFEPRQRYSLIKIENEPIYMDHSLSLTYEKSTYGLPDKNVVG